MLIVDVDIFVLYISVYNMDDTHLQQIHMLMHTDNENMFTTDTYRQYQHQVVINVVAHMSTQQLFDTVPSAPMTRYFRGAVLKTETIKYITLMFPGAILVNIIVS